MDDISAEKRFEILREFIPEGFVGAEIGVFKGHFSKMLLRKNPRKLYLVDPWYRAGAQWLWAKNQDNSTLNAFKKILEVFDKEIRNGVVCPVVDFSENFLNAMEEHSFDLFYLDSSHSYKDTKTELELISLILKPEGVCLGDDWRDDENHRHYGVTKAIKEFIQEGRCKLLFHPVHMQWGVKFI